MMDLQSPHSGVDLVCPPAQASAVHPDLERVLLSEADLERIVDRVAARINADYAGKTLVVVGVLRGSVVFVADLIRRLTVPVRLDFVAVSSYGSDFQTSGEVRFLKDLEESVAGQHVLIVEDIIDTGLTLKYLQESLQTREAASVRTCALLDKPSRRKVEAQADYVGTVVPDEFLVGYGLDYAQRYRNLPVIGVLKRTVYEP